MTKTKTIFLVLPLCSLLLLAGCSSPDVEQMKTGLIKSGMAQEEADCFAKKMSKTVPAKPYNYMAQLMNAGVSEQDAINKTRRKYGAEFKAFVKDARTECVE